MEDKKIAIWGWGKEGISTAKFLQRRGISFTLLNDTDVKVDKSFSNVEDVVIGNKISNVLRHFDIVIKSPGISLYRKEIQLVKRNVVFTSATNLWFEYYAPKYKTIAITGTKGKSTTSSLLTHILRSNGFVVTLAGNIGTPLLDTCDAVCDIYVIELSSYQIADLEYSADINILLNLYPEHLDWHQSIEQYFHDKTKIFRNNENAFNIVNAACISKKLPHNATFNDKDLYAIDDGIYDKRQKIISDSDISLRGVHNYTNICAILLACQCLCLPLNKIKESLITFEPLEYRMHKVATRETITYVCDSISTTPQSTLAAIKTFHNDKLVVILGGQDRGLDWEEFAKELQQCKVHFVINTYETGKKIHTFLQQDGYEQTAYAIDLARAVSFAKKITPRDGVILLSPAAPGYDAFLSFKEKGDVFVKLIDSPS
ncbi:UDP-N-acetylmuramoyl-L-alanine--D-glutamate ligase [Candidatus Uabimicrobium amorphum]|uniref:UDP-N-acetylmuramoylalanine--D-glutamate ligase n=1 Tax=Uabimicrobium amorphum TaxID=2596890 RepID=A0A5S9F2R8_UABAM|nr:UDP-N-acetylmuramoyl-L-alanine--D-glutamate ligase [Candidatus Uabimicrobium amorphum]BBM82654.1 UDP-N-acetylmuramoylalanine--D-glutamate ligase [Candidatus Uabimicrobium amorphum]